MSQLTGGLRLVLLTVSATACQGLPQQTRSIEAIEASASEVRVRAVQLGRLFATEIERAADSIRAVTAEPSIRRHALLWKMYAIPAAHEAVLLPDPGLSIADAWAFAIQMEDYFDQGAGQNVFGPHQSIALDAVRRLEGAALDQLLLMADSTEGDGQAGREQLVAFAERNPILGPQFGRTSLAAEAPDLLGTDATSAVTAVGDINQAVGELTNRLAFHNEYLLKQASWATLEILEGLAQDSSVTATLASVTEALQNAPAVAEALEKASALAEELPSLVESERSTVLEALHNELAVLIEAVDVQRGATLAVFSAELAALIDVVHEERSVVLEAITAERVATIEAAKPLLEEAIDHAIWRIAQLLAAVGVFIVLSRTARRFSGRNSPPDRSD